MERFASFDGAGIAYLVRGHGPDVLLMHGFASDADGNWVRPGIVDALVASGRRVVAYDARGHGESDKPHDEAAYAGNAMVRDARALLDHLAVDAVDVVGYSMGSLVASRLIPVEPRARSLVLGGVGGRMTARGTSARRDRIAAALEARAGAQIEGRSARAFRRFAERSHNDLVALAAIQRAALKGQHADLDAIRVPTLVVAGIDDRLAGSPQELADKLPDAVAAAIPGNHLSAVMRPELARAILDFLARVSPASP